MTTYTPLYFTQDDNYNLAFANNINGGIITSGGLPSAIINYVDETQIFIYASQSEENYYIIEIDAYFACTNVPYSLINNDTTSVIINYKTESSEVLISPTSIPDITANIYPYTPAPQEGIFPYIEIPGFFDIYIDPTGIHPSITLTTSNGGITESVNIYGSPGSTNQPYISIAEYLYLSDTNNNTSYYINNLDLTNTITKIILYGSDSNNITLTGSQIIYPPSSVQAASLTGSSINTTELSSDNKYGLSKSIKAYLSFLCLYDNIEYFKIDVYQNGIKKSIKENRIPGVYQGFYLNVLSDFESQIKIFGYTSDNKKITFHDVKATINIDDAGNFVHTNESTIRREDITQTITYETIVSAGVSVPCAC